MLKVNETVSNWYHEKAIDILAKKAKKEVNNRICWETLSQNKKATKILAKESKRKNSGLYVHDVITIRRILCAEALCRRI